MTFGPKSEAVDKQGFAVRSRYREVHRNALAGVLLVAVTVAVYWPVRYFDFVNCDDPVYVCENVHVQEGLTRESIRWAFTSLDGGFWHPLTWLSFMVDYELFGLRAGGYHQTNLLLHTANTLLLFVVLRRITGATWRSAAVAGLFAMHPLHVESVAWISDRKDVLSLLFWLLSLLMYVRYVEGSSTRSKSYKVLYGFALVFFVCGLMSKPTVLTLPLIFLLLDWWPLHRFEPTSFASQFPTAGRLIVEKLPFLGAAVAAGLLAIYGQQALGVLSTAAQFPVANRIANALLSCARYIAQTLWPADLAVYYPYPSAFPTGPLVGAAFLLVAGSAVILWASRRRPYLAVGWLWYLVTLFPTIGLFQVGGHSRADRYTYVPLIGLFLLLVWTAHDLTKRWRHQAVSLLVVGVALAACCLAVTRKQLSYWKDNETLFSHALAVTVDNPLARNDLGTALASQGRLEDAIAQFRQALRLDPRHIEARLNLGKALALAGKKEEALAQFREAVASKPDSAPAHGSLASALLLDHKIDEAKAQFLEALRLNSAYAEAHTGLGNLLVLLGAPEDGLRHLFEAVRIRDNCENGHYFLANALARQGRMEEAAVHFRSAIRIRPDHAAALNDLAWILATEDDPKIRTSPEAIRLSTHACEITGYTNAVFLDTLGMALSQAGRSREAIRAAERALELAITDGQEKLAGQIRSHLQLYRQKPAQ